MQQIWVNWGFTWCSGKLFHVQIWPSYCCIKMKQTQKLIFHQQRIKIKILTKIPDSSTNSRKVLTVIPCLCDHSSQWVTKWVQWRQTKLISCLLNYSKRAETAVQRASCSSYCMLLTHIHLHTALDLGDLNRVYPHLSRLNNQQKYHILTTSRLSILSILPNVSRRPHKITIALKVAF